MTRYRAAAAIARDSGRVNVPGQNPWCWESADDPSRRSVTVRCVNMIASNLVCDYDPTIRDQSQAS
eukprot:759828-Hanusia_phi.AAC.1